MITATLTQTAKPAQCTTGTPWHQWMCGWDQPHHAAAAAAAGHTARPFVLLALVALAVLVALKVASRGSRASAQGS